MTYLNSAARNLFIAAAIVLFAGTKAFATPVFESDETYVLAGSFWWGPTVQNMTFTKDANGNDSTLTYNSNTKTLTLDAAFHSSQYGNKIFDFQMDFGVASLHNGAVDTDPTSALDVTFSKTGPTKDSASYVSFAVLSGLDNKGDLTAPGLSFLHLNDISATGGMSPLIRSYNGQLYFDAWLTCDVQGDLHNITITKRPPGNEVPEPMTMGLLATGLIGGVVRRKLKIA